MSVPLQKNVSSGEQATNNSILRICERLAQGQYFLFLCHGKRVAGPGGALTKLESLRNSEGLARIMQNILMPVPWQEGGELW